MTLTARPAAHVLDELRRSVVGPVLCPDDDGYDAAVRGHNLGYFRRPSIAVVASSPQDVAAAVAVAADHRLPVHVQSTGHGTTGPLEGGLLLLTSRLQRLEVDAVSRTLTVGAGVVWGDAVAAAEAAGFGVLPGSGSSVGVVGYTLGGGLGPLGRAHGFASDHLVAIELVGADGVSRVVDAADDPELFAALRGGKYGLGIVTALVFRMLDAPHVVGRRLYADATDAGLLLQRLVDTPLPDSCTPSWRLMQVPDLPALPPPLRGRAVVELTATACADHEQNAALWTELTAGVSPLLVAESRGGMTDWFAAFSDPAGAMPSWQSGRLLGELDPDGVRTLVELVGPARELPLLAVEVRRLGGALTAPADRSGPDAVGGRDAAWSLSVIGAPDPGLFATVLPAVVEQLEAGLEPWLHGGTLVNFHGPVTVASPLSRAWSAEIDAHLAAVRRRVDPHGLLALPRAH